METPNILKGYLYPSSRVSRCPHFHACTVSKKCQMYNRHNADCAFCEMRVTNQDPEMLGGFLPEGEYIPDYQDSIGILEKKMLKSWAHPDNEGTKYNPRVTDPTDKITEAANKLSFFNQDGDFTLEEKVATAIMNPEFNKYLGRIK